jgi:hypothetical protein
MQKHSPVGSTAANAKFELMRLKPRKPFVFLANLRGQRCQEDMGKVRRPDKLVERTGDCCGVGTHVE